MCMEKSSPTGQNWCGSVLAKAICRYGLFDVEQ